MKIRQFKTDDIIFIEDEICVILDGIVHLKSHAENVIPPKLLAKY